jgi:hypothetical protein
MYVVQKRDDEAFCTKASIRAKILVEHCGQEAHPDRALQNTARSSDGRLS